MTLQSHRIVWFVLFSAALLGHSVVLAQDTLGYRVEREDRLRASSVAGIDPGISSRGLAPLRSFGAFVDSGIEFPAELGEGEAVVGGPHRLGFLRGSIVQPNFRLDATTGQVEGAGWRTDRSARGVVWSGVVRVEGAFGLRLRMDFDAALPLGSQIWLVSHTRRETWVRGPFSSELMDSDGGMWLPAVPGSEAAVEVHVPLESLDRAPASFSLQQVVELFDTEGLRADSLHTAPFIADTGAQCNGADAALGESNDWESCSEDAMCIGTSQVAAIDNIREAAARILFMVGDVLLGCSATLLADVEQTGTPYLLTANHCFETQASAASLTAYFDYRTDACNGAAPNLFDVPSVAGATLLATTDANDMTLVELSGVPSGSTHFLGWTTQRPGAGETLYSATHPAGSPQRFASSAYIPEGETAACEAFQDQRDLWHLSSRVQGSTFFGSSGGGIVVDRNGGQVVGQIRGVCHQEGALDWCDASSFDNIIGSFEQTHPLVAAWLGAEVASVIFEDGFETGQVSQWSMASP